ncbi:MAG: hypothetical protein LBV59_24135 [Sphingobacterium sp.]|jgi:hypothetical protein|uniref:hypothetical protein n=1 Tax=Sphingobacterium sp. TaxID=341027 RepID=UPI00284931F1|nr:hypothetical protein [Sphingobacterium sp.]MDR3011037.1 hypothetical protein [Sphingobacterium sp.]
MISSILLVYLLFPAVSNQKSLQDFDNNANSHHRHNQPRSSSLHTWTGIYLNSGNQKLTSYHQIKKIIGWYELKISPKEIVFSNDSRMESEFPTESPGGYVIHYICNYSISEDTIRIYKKDENDHSVAPRKVSGSHHELVLLLTKKDNKYYAASPDIEESENLVNSIRLKSTPPYRFYRFNINTINRQ